MVSAEHGATFCAVGHGAAAVLQSSQSRVIVDVGTNGDALMEELAGDSSDVAAIVLTHLHDDHAGAVLDVLERWDPQYICVNPFGAASHIELFREILARVDASPRTQWIPLVEPWTLELPGVSLRTYWPFVGEFEALGLPPPPDGWSKDILLYQRWAADLADAISRMESVGASSINHLSVLTIAEFRDSAIRLLFGGDLDGLSLAKILGSDYLSLPDSNYSLVADIVSWPHHGGRPGRASPERFASDFMDLTNPSVVHFSTGLRHPRNPLPEILSGIFLTVAEPAVRIRCSGLSELCGSSRSHGALCAGTVKVDLQPWTDLGSPPGEILLRESRLDFETFVTNLPGKCVSLRRY